ncbi:MAG: hypothetical protein KatS3mg094_395 [Candidatus Parcubacteria bacterium]|nr:MAG: hypothetical protein KatS3mg094_395 [Candidatus Parcubacteria bacterium]
MEQKNYILKIIPIQPLPPNSPDFFLYFSPIKVENGSLVEINFRGKNIPGYTWDSRKISEVKFIIKNLDYQIKPIKNILIEKDILLDYQKKLAFKISRYYYLSLAYSFYLFLKYYKKCNLINLKEKLNKNYSQFENINRRFEINFYQELTIDLINEINKYRSLIIFPVKHQANNFYFNFKNKIPKLIYLNDITKNSDYIFSNENYTFLGSKNIIFLPLINIEKIFVFNEGSIFYNEFFKTPKINYLELIESYAKLSKCSLNYIDNFYSLKSYIKFPKLSHPKINFISFADISYLTKINGIKKVFVFQKNIGQKLFCLDCHYRFECQKCKNYLTIIDDSLFCNKCLIYYSITKCPRCQGDRLYIKKIGKEFIKKYLSNHNLRFFDIESELDLKKIKNSKNNDYFIIGNWQILDIPTDYSFFINFDVSFLSENIFLKEKYLRIIKQLENSSKKVFVHTRLDKKFLNKIKEGIIIKDIIKERELNYLPPFCYQIKLISRLTNLESLNYRLINIKEKLKVKIKNNEIKILGPFLERFLKVNKRYQMYLLLKSKKRINVKEILNGIEYIEKVEFDDYDI